MKINGKPDGGGGSGVITGLSVTENGIYMPSAGVDGFAPVDVDVQPSLQDKTVSVNGSYTADQGYYGLSTVTVNVPDIPAVTESLTVSVNNTYYPGQGVDGFSQVIVDVPQSVTGFTLKQTVQKDYMSSEIYDPTVTEVLEFGLAGAYYSHNTGGFQVIHLTQIVSLNLPNCKKIHQYGLFYNILQSVSLPKCVQLDPYAFNTCSFSEITLPRCRYIYDHTFAECTKLTNVSLPHCQFVGSSSVFVDCTSLTSIELPICTFLGNTGFIWCGNLTQVTLPNIETFGTSIFSGCGALTSLTLGTNTSKIAGYNNNLFKNFPNINNLSIYVPSETYNSWITATGWSSYSAKFVSVEYSEPLYSISDGMVYGRLVDVNGDWLNTALGINKTDITSLSFPNCAFINNFSGCTNLSEVYLPNCMDINSNCFSGCSLTQVNLPVCESIYQYAFRSCPLSKITLGLTDVCWLNAYAFYDTPIWSGTGSIYVPASLVDTYKSANIWSQYSSQIFPIE